VADACGVNSSTGAQCASRVRPSPAIPVRYCRWVRQGRIVGSELPPAACSGRLNGPMLGFVATILEDTRPPRWAARAVRGGPSAWVVLAGCAQAISACSVPERDYGEGTDGLKDAGHSSSWSSSDASGMTSVARDSSLAPTPSVSADAGSSGVILPEPELDPAPPATALRTRSAGLTVPSIAPQPSPEPLERAVRPTHPWTPRATRGTERVTVKVPVLSPTLPRSEIPVKATTSAAPTSARPGRAVTRSVVTRVALASALRAAPRGTVTPLPKRTTRAVRWRAAPIRPALVIRPR
jgi:hypothetical protein